MVKKQESHWRRKQVGWRKKRSGVWWQEDGSTEPYVNWRRVGWCGYLIVCAQCHYIAGIVTGKDLVLTELQSNLFEVHLENLDFLLLHWSELNN